MAAGTIRVDGRICGRRNGRRHLHWRIGAGPWYCEREKNVAVAGRLEGCSNASGTLRFAATGRIGGGTGPDSLIEEDGARSQGNCQRKTNAIDTE